MCNRTIVLEFLFLVKFLIPILFIILLIFQNKINRGLIKYLNILYFFLIIIIILFFIFNQSCITDSTITEIKNKIKSNQISKKSITEDSDQLLEKIDAIEKYKTSNNSNVYYFNNISFPLSNQSMSCATDTVYMKDYGNEITAVSIMVSSILDENIDPIEILDLAKANNIIDCNNRINIDKLLSVVNNKYKLYSVNVDSYSANNKVKGGEVILAEVNYVEGMDNIACDRDYVVIYKINNDNKYVILNPSKRDNDYICPDNTKGFLSVIKSKDTSYSVDDINKICSRYIYMGRN